MAASGVEWAAIVRPGIADNWRPTEGVSGMPDTISASVETIDGLRTAVLRESATGSEAHVVVELGSNLHRFATRVGGRTVEVLAGAPDVAALRERPSRYGSAVLFPYPGRIENGTFTFEGREIHLPLGPDGNAIHGVTRSRPFELVSTDASAANGAQVVTRLDSRAAAIPAEEWPFAFTLTLTTTLKDGVVRIATEVVNTGDGPMPIGLGFHPYFPAGPDEEVFVEADELWEQGGQGLPTGKIDKLGPSDGLRQPRPLRDVPPTISMPEGQVRNLLFRRHGNGIRAGVRYPSARYQVTLECGPGFGAMVFFTPVTPPVVSLEPHTCVPNAFNVQGRGLDAGMIVLPRGGRWADAWEMRVSEL
jgi:aldose 1-epimerase